MTRISSKPKSSPETSSRNALLLEEETHDEAAVPLTKLESNRNFVISFARGLEVIQSFYNESQGISAARIAKKTGLSRAAVRRFLITLEILGYAEDVEGIYHLRPSVLRIGCSYLTSTTLPSLAQPILEQVSELIHESTSLSAIDEDNIIYLARHTSSKILSVGLSVGSRLPAYCTSMGRVMLADLPPKQLNQYLSRLKMKKWTSKTVTSKTALINILNQVAKDRYAIVDGELEPGLRSIAVPIRTPQGRTIAAMNAGAHISSVSVEDMTVRILPVLRQHAEILSRLL
jgi:IclR family transcriptional regulator, pca regulon regulatory protein